MNSDDIGLRVLRYGELLAPGPPAGSGANELKIRSLASHPLAHPDLPAAVLLIARDVVVGRFWLIPARIRIAERSYPVMYGSDYFITGEGISASHTGALFLRALREAGSLGVSDISVEASRVYRAARLEIRTVPRQTLLLRSFDHIRSHVSHTALAHALAAPLDVVLRLLRASRGRAVTARGASLVHVARFGEEIDRIDCASRGTSWFERGHAELNWAIEHPWLDVAKYRFMGFQLRASADVVGYALVRVRAFGAVTVASIMRSGVLPSVANGHATLLRTLIAAMEQVGVSVLDMSSSDPRAVSAARQLGMIVRGEIRHGLRLTDEPGAAARALGLRFSDVQIEMGEGDKIMG